MPLFGLKTEMALSANEKSLFNFPSEIGVI